MLPADLRQYLSHSDRSWKLDAGEIRELTLYSADDAPLRKFDVDSDELYLNGPLTVDPKETREYKGYDLIQACNSYDPTGILIWFPDWREYGSWDCDHHTMITYPGVIWAQIAADPTWYVNGQWYPDKIEHRKINPWASDT